jgi:hypothetical protein
MATNDIDTGFEPSLTILNNNAGLYIVLFGTRLSRMIEIIEDGSVAVPQGLQYYTPDPTNTPGCTYPAASGIVANPGNWLGPYVYTPEMEPIRLGNIYAIHQPWGGTVANGPNIVLGVGVTSGTPYIKLRSAGANPTTVRVTEFS